MEEKATKDKKHIHLYLTHEAAKGVLPVGKGNVKDDGRINLNYKQTEEGNWPSTAALNILYPDYCIHAHHHITYKRTFNETEVYGLGLINKENDAYVIFTVDDGKILSLETKILY